MNKIQQIQTVLNVTADGDFGPISYDALDDALQDPDTIKQIQGILGVAQDGDWGPLTRGAFQAALQPQTPGTGPTLSRSIPQTRFSLAPAGKRW